MTRTARLRGTVTSVWRATACLALAAIASCESSNTYRLGIVASTDGERGAALAVADINAAGGVNGHPIELRSVGGNSNSSAAIALQVAETLAADARVLAVIGHPNSSASLAASQVYNARHVVQLAPTSTTPLYSNAGPYSFRLVGSDVFQAAFLADAVAKGARSSVAVVYVNDDYGRSLSRSLTQALAVRNVTNVRAYPYAEQDSAGQRELLASLAEQHPTTLAWLGRVHYFELMADSLHRRLPGVDIIASDGFGSGVVDDDTTGRFTGIRHVRLTDVTRNDSALQEVRRRFRAARTGDLSDEAALTYDAVRLLADAIRQAGPDRNAIREWLSQTGRGRPPYNGITGPISFTASGDRVAHYVLVTAGRPPRGSAAQ